MLRHRSRPAAGARRDTEPCCSPPFRQRVWDLPPQEAATPPPVAGGNTAADRSKLKLLQKDFTSGPEGTAACETCHTEAGDQVMHSIHWIWSYRNPKTDALLGKRNLLNAFRGSVASNEPRCTSCRAGYGRVDMRQDPPAGPAKVDCHAAPDLYTGLDNAAGNPPLAPLPPKAMTIASAPAMPVDLSKAAQSVGMPTRENCGQRHFYGGGDNVKHGDLSSALVDADRPRDRRAHGCGRAELRLRNLPCQ